MKRHHRRLLARLRALFPSTHRRKVIVRRRGSFAEPWDVFVPARTFDGWVVVSIFTSLPSATRNEAIRWAMRRRERGLQENGLIISTRDLAHLQHGDEGLPLPWYSSQPQGGSEYDV